MKNEMVDILAMLLLLIITVFCLYFVVWYSVPQNEVMERWASYDKQAVKEYQEQNWYISSLN